MRRVTGLVLLVLVAACDLPTPPLVATSITMSHTNVSFDALGQTSQLAATVKDQSGATMSGATVTWSTSAASVATVSSSGLVTAGLNAGPDESCAPDGSGTSG